MKNYTTSQIANKTGIHPNTVRFYEEIGFLPPIPRKENGYRMYNEIHLEQLKLIRIGLKSELLQNGLRTETTNIIKASASGDYDKALKLSKEHLNTILREQNNAEESISIIENEILSKTSTPTSPSQKNYTRKQTADYLGLTIDTLRNWELNGLLVIKRKENGYRVYNEYDIKKLKIINSLRCANYSLSSILRLLNSLGNNESADIKIILNTPTENENIVSVCDKLLISLENAKDECKKMMKQIQKIKKINPPV